METGSINISTLHRNFPYGQVLYKSIALHPHIPIYKPKPKCFSKCNIQYLPTQTVEMSSMKKKHFLACLLVFALAILFEPTNATEFHKWQIHVLNELSNDQMLFVHCKSRDDNLGQHNVSVGNEFNWSFRVNFWNTTLFWCFLRKPNAQSVSFEAFWIEKTSIWLFYRCYDSNCIWTAKDDGVYLRDNPARRDVLVHKWK